MLTRYRPILERTARPLGQAMARAGISANAVTVLSLAAGGGAGALLAFGRPAWSILFIFLMMLLDALDGAVARAQGKPSAFGQVLDHTLDRFAEILVLGGILLGGLCAPAYAYAAMTGMLMASYVRAKAESVGLGPCTAGLAGRSEKMMLLGAGLVVEIFLPGRQVLNWFLLAIALISYVTALQRLLYARRLAAKAVEVHEAEQPRR